MSRQVTATINHTMRAGRKRTFDTTDALDKAMRVFWRNGYAGTSMNDLTQALGIAKPSLYAAFGNKEDLYAAALEHYMAQYGAPLQRRLREPADAPLAQRLRNYLDGVLDLIADTGSPRGCLFVKSSCELGGSAMPEQAAAALHDMDLANEKALTDVLASERRHGRLQGHADPRHIAGLVIATIYGLSVLARQGRPRAQLDAVADALIVTLLPSQA